MMAPDLAHLQPSTYGLADPVILAARSTPLEGNPQIEDADPTSSEAPKSFAHLIGRIMDSARQTPEEHDAAVRKQVEELLATTLVQPILKNLNNDPLESGLFQKTHGEQELRPMLEAEIAKSIVHGIKSGLVDQVARRLLSANRTPVQTSGRRLDVTERSLSHA